MTVIYPGTFDPVTNGHLDIIKRAAAFSQQLIVAILNNVLKQSVFTIDERLAHLASLTAHIKHVRVVEFGGLQVDLAKAYQANVIIRGLRSTQDLNHELAIAHGNRCLSPSVETLFIPTSPAYSFISSGLVREIAAFGGDISGMVPPLVNNALADKMQEIRTKQ